MRRYALLLSLAATPAAGDFSLVLPVDCSLGDTCFIQQFMDHDPTAGQYDFRCGSLTYNGHKGTDFALDTLDIQAQGVAVLAAADGVVTGVRDGMADHLQGQDGAPDVSDRECGNGLVIRHADGFETQYCHLARGSLQVETGQQVAAGDLLGKIGLSGKTEFPHLHLSVRLNGKPIDPFNVDGVQSCPDDSLPSLWADTLPAPAGGIVAIGLAQTVPTFADIKAGIANTGATANGPAIVGWAHLFGVQAGDHLITHIIRPSGKIINHTETLDRTQARIFRAFGKRTPQGGWPKGTYRLEIQHMRGETQLDIATADYIVD